MVQCQSSGFMDSYYQSSGSTCGGIFSYFYSEGCEIDQDGRNIKENLEIAKQESEVEITTISIPKGWEIISLLDKVVKYGYCSYTDLCNGNISITDFLFILNMMSWRDFVETRSLSNGNSK